jgi:hypothetical protein
MSEEKAKRPCTLGCVGRPGLADPAGPMVVTTSSPLEPGGGLHGGELRP